MLEKESDLRHKHTIVINFHCLIYNYGCTCLSSFNLVMFYRFFFSAVGFIFHSSRIWILNAYKNTYILKDHHWFAPFIQIASGFALTLISRVHNAFDFFTIFLSLVFFFGAGPAVVTILCYKVICKFLKQFFREKNERLIAPKLLTVFTAFRRNWTSKRLSVKKRNEIDFKEKWYVNFIFEDIIGHNLGVLFKHSFHILQSYFELHFVLNIHKLEAVQDSSCVLMIKISLSKDGFSYIVSFCRWPRPHEHCAWRGSQHLCSWCPAPVLPRNNALKRRKLY